MKRKDVLLLLIPTFIVVLLWVVFSVYHSYINSTIPTDVNMQILYIEPDFDLKTIEDLKKRQIVAPIDAIELGAEQDLTTEDNTLDSQETLIDQELTPIITSPDVASSSATGESLGGDEQINEE